MIYYFKTLNCNNFAGYKVDCVVLTILDSILPHVEFGPNDPREDTPRFKNENMKS